MHKCFDYLEPDLPVNVIRDLLGYIRRFAALFSGGVPVEGAMAVAYTHLDGYKRQPDRGGCWG